MGIWAIVPLGNWACYSFSPTPYPYTLPLHTPPHSRHHLLHHLIRSRAIGHILVVHVYIIFHLLFRQVRKSGAVNGPYCIDAAHIGLKIQELAGLFHIHPVADLIQVQVFLFEFIHRHVEVGGDADEVFFGKSGAHRFAAVGTGEAIHILPNFFVDLFGHGVQLARGILSQFGKEHPEAALVQVNHFPEGTKVDGLHSSE